MWVSDRQLRFVDWWLGVADQCVEINESAWVSNQGCGFLIGGLGLLIDGLGLLISVWRSES